LCLSADSPWFVSTRSTLPESPLVVTPDAVMVNPASEPTAELVRYTELIRGLSEPSRLWSERTDGPDDQN
jgi:hypothetical protein